ncbi:MAG: rod shape-determining protein MreC [bacterium]|nr:rod shape-determining protein MreC [bacterium]
MKKLGLLKLLIILVAVGLLVFLIFVNSFRSDNSYVFLKNTRVYVFSNINIFSSFFSKINSISRLTEENIFLKNENAKLNTLLASQSDLIDQNKFLRDILNLKTVPGYRFIDARTFNMQFTPEGHYFLLNKGLESDIQVDDIILSSSGVLIGTVSETESGFSRANLATNLDFKITIRVLGKNTTGIARGILNDGLRIDFISQNDDIVKGDIIVSNGNDLFPPGLLVGSVSEITSSDDGGLFKKVTLEPEFKKINVDRVLVLRPFAEKQ